MVATFMQLVSNHYFLCFCKIFITSSLGCIVHNVLLNFSWINNAVYNGIQVVSYRLITSLVDKVTSTNNVSK